MQNIKDTKEVNDFLKGIENPLKKIVVLLREIILNTDKEITEHIKWNAPSFCYRYEDRITMNSKDRIMKDNFVSLMFHRGAKKKDTKGFIFKDDEGLFQWQAPDRALIKFATVEDVEAKKAVIKKIVKKWIQATA